VFGCAEWKFGVECTFLSALWVECALSALCAKPKSAQPRAKAWVETCAISALSHLLSCGLSLRFIDEIPSRRNYGCALT
jgi:hypothetical protein